VSRGLIQEGSSVEVEELSGGVSNIVFSVSDGKRDIVLKQALPELKVATLWVADQRRAIVEAKAIEFFNRISPTNVPALIDSDPDIFTLALERAPRTSRVWKTELLSGIAEPIIGYKLGEVLASWHKEGNIEVVRDSFSEWELFNQLRLTPFYRAVLAKNETLSHQINYLIRDLEDNKSTIVHGDFSPKNILVNGQADVYILDFEVAHWGNPVFDLAFLIAHLLCKFTKSSDSNYRKDITDLVSSFLEGYEIQKSPQINETLGWHVALIALARVEGQSPVNYLSEANQISIQRLTKSVLTSDRCPEVLELFKMEN
jgi:5-methylthioribose kinase